MMDRVVGYADSTVPPLSEFPEAARFTETAKEFCSLIENSESAEPRAFFRRCFVLVSQLIAQAAQLPHVDGDLDTARESSQSYANIVRALKQQTRDRDYYQMVFYPYGSDEKIIVGSISDDLADTWRELKQGLSALQAGSPANAIAAWRFSFEWHWGPFHATHVLRPLFDLVFDDRE